MIKGGIRTEDCRRTFVRARYNQVERLMATAHGMVPDPM